MSNEVVLILTLIFTYGSVLIWFKLFGEYGLVCFNILATIAANVEVMILIKAFGMHQTLGNILFASTFLVTDILNETYGKKSADRAANLSILASLFFILMSQSWMMYTPLEESVSSSNIRSLFSNTPRIMISGFIVYAIVQKLDVLLYQRIWKSTENYCGEKKKYLWLRNNVSTLISQFVNTVLFTLLAFYGKYDFKTLFQIMFSSYIIFIFTSLADTPILYISRRIHSNIKK